MSQHLSVMPTTKTPYLYPENWRIHKEETSMSLREKDRAYYFTLSKVEGGHQRFKKLTVSVSVSFLRHTREVNLLPVTTMYPTISTLLAHIFREQTNGNDFCDSNGHLTFSRNVVEFSPSAKGAPKAQKKNAPIYLEDQDQEIQSIFLKFFNAMNVDNADVIVTDVIPRYFPS